MLEIHYDRIKKINGNFIVDCICGKTSSFKSKGTAVNLLKRNSCRYCSKRYQKTDLQGNIYKKEKKWCCICSGCNIEQCYTRKDHAKQSSIFDWQCKNCIGKSKGFSNNRSVGDKQRYYNRFYKSAIRRGINWDLNVETMFEKFNGYCALTNWEISIHYSQSTASLDRIDSNLGYTLDNIQWVHTMVNMSKNKYKQEDFVKMCIAVSNKVKW